MYREPRTRFHRTVVIFRPADLVKAIGESDRNGPVRWWFHFLTLTALWHRLTAQVAIIRRSGFQSKAHHPLFLFLSVQCALDRGFDRMTAGFF